MAIFCKFFINTYFMVFFQKKTANYLKNGKEVVYEKSTIYARKNYFYIVENIRTVILKK